MFSNNRRMISGFTLFEVLITVVIVSVGLLGAAKLQVMALKQSQNAAQRTQATILAYDILDRMRANRTAALSESYDIDLGESPSGSSLAILNLDEWKIALSNPALLPGGDGSIDLDPSNDKVTITVRWNERAGQSDDDSPIFTAFTLQTMM